MDYSDWRKYYLQIVKEFKFNINEDERSAKLLANLLSKKNIVSVNELSNLLENKNIVIFGDSKNLEKQTDRKYPEVLIAANGATSVLLKKGIVPTIIVTDLDGNIKDQISANKKGSVVIVHAHGDNLNALKKWVPRFKGKILGTTQSKPFSHIHNFGGFTDGDRAVCIANHFKAKKVKLVGFDFETPKTKKGKEKRSKLRKLKWAKKIITALENTAIQF